MRAVAMTIFLAGTAMALSVPGAAAPTGGTDPTTRQESSETSNACRWSVDPPLRQDMRRIGNTLQQALPDIDAKLLPTDGYHVVGRKISGVVADIIKDCELDPARPEADELQAILAELRDGAKAMEGRSTRLTRRQGAAKIGAALHQFARDFEDPGWYAM